MPVQIRKATQHNAMFAVDADAAQRLIDYSGLQVYRPFRGRAIATLIVAQFVDSDLGQYFEYSTCVMVKPPGADAAAVQSVFVAHMFVDQAFTLAAGRTISLIVDGPASRLLDLYLILEIFAGSLGLVVLAYAGDRATRR